jgi:hypothetical protein
MRNFIKQHPYIISFAIVFLLLFFIGILALEFSVGDALFGAAALAAVGVGSAWWKFEGLG